MYIAIDMGGTNTRIAFSENLKDIRNVEKYPTPQSAEEIKQNFKNLIDVTNLRGLILGTAGQVNHSTKQILFSPHINGINGLTLNELVGLNSDTEGFIENDAALAGLAESHQPYAQDFERVAYITISTGVGGTLIVNKKLRNTKLSFEPGHHIIDINGNSLALENIKGTWESLSSGTAFRKLYNENPEECNDQEIWNQYGQNLSKGLHNIILMWQPDLIVLGGSLSKKYDLFEKALNQELAVSLGENVVPIATSQMDDMNGITGGFIFLNQVFSA